MLAILELKEIAEAISDLAISRFLAPVASKRNTSLSLGVNCSIADGKASDSMAIATEPFLVLANNPGPR